MLLRRPVYSPVRDRDASVRWYGDVLGIQQHRDADGAFDHRRPGLDHLAFAVETRADLDDWHARLTGLGVTCSPVAETAFGPVLCFRDPDGVQLELFAMEARG